jgi:hypothetical protein
MYDVVYLDPSGHQNVVGTQLAKERACEVALDESRRRGVGRMFLAGSEETHPLGAQVLIVKTPRSAAA